jgi:hypothetical protein
MLLVVLGGTGEEKAQALLVSRRRSDGARFEASPTLTP